MYVPPALEKMIAERHEEVQDLHEGHVAEWEVLVEMLDEPVAREFWAKYRGEHEPLHAVHA